MSKESNKKTVNTSDTHNTLKNICVSVVVILFFVFIVIIYYNMLYSEKREGIIKTGQITAIESAKQFDAYLVSARNAIEVSSYTINEMMKSGRSNKEILDYLVENTNAIMGSIFKETTGLYGWINEEYMDGVLWDPGPDFVAEERPWYKGAIAGGGKITIIEPYKDAQTGSTMMSIVKMLDDGKSVVAMDVILDNIQTITEEAVAGGNSDCEMIIDSDGIVVAHSDKKEVGKNYREETGNLWAEIAAGAGKSDMEYTEVKTGRKEYIVYAVALEDGWRCLSVRDTTKLFGSLKVLFVLTVIIVIVAVLILMGIFNQSSKRYRVAKRLNKQLSSTAEIYRSAYELDIQNDTFSSILSRGENLEDMFLNIREYAQKELLEFINRFADPSYLEEMRRFVNFKTLSERMKDTNTIIKEFVSVEGRWIRARFIVSQYTPEGEVAHVLWLTEDVDEERRNRERLIDISERALAASEAKSAFLSNMSHEIRTPINAILGMNEMILRECDEDDIVEYSENIKTAGETLLDIVNEVLDFSKIEAGKIDIIPVEYDLSSLINDLVNMVSAKAGEKGLELVLGIDGNIPKLLMGDEVRIKQIITNLLTNAVKYTEEGSVSFTMGFNRVQDTDDCIMLNVAVIDTGVGIKEENIDSLFDEFQRIDEAKNRYVEGTGLGMSITKSLLEMMGSSLEVDSTYGSGSIFKFSLTQKVVAWEPLGDYVQAYRKSVKEKRTYRESFIAQNAHILVVDDNPMNLMVFKSLLKQTRINIDTADSGDRGIGLTRNKKYDMIFLDHMMPEKDGIQTLHEIRSMEDNPNRDTVAICLTANAILGAREEYLSQGFDDYLTKPINPETTEKMLVKYLPAEKVTLTEEKKKEPIEIPEELKPLALSGLVDIEKGIMNNGSAEEYFSTLEIFYASMDEEAARINKYYSEEDIENYTIKVHALKSSAKIIGATEFAEAAQLLENAGKNEDMDFIDVHHGAFMQNYMDFKKPLSMLFAKTEDDTDKFEADRDMMAGIFEEIREAAEDMDSDYLEDIIARMSDYRIPEERVELWNRIKAASDRFDYEAITEALNEDL